MDDKDFINGKHGSPTVFNNPEDSDIILQCGTERFFAHRAILRLWSPFFARSLNSQFPVAKSAVFEIDDDDMAGAEPFCALLKHMYGMPFGKHPENEDYRHENSLSVTEHCIRVYMAADRYDVPSVRIAAVASVEDFLTCDIPCEESVEEFSQLSIWVANICGPEAPQLADGALRSVLFEWVSSNFDRLSQDHHFAEKIEDGSLLDTELNAKLLFALSAKIRRQNARDKATGVRH